jgi:hypothetical protein
MLKTKVLQKEINCTLIAKASFLHFCLKITLFPFSSLFHSIYVTIILQQQSSIQNGDEDIPLDIVILDAGSLFVYGSHFVNPQREHMIAASDNSTVILKNSNITNSSATVRGFTSLDTNG